MKEKVLLLGANGLVGRAVAAALREAYQVVQIGRASCRERVCQYV